MKAMESPTSTIRTNRKMKMLTYRGTAGLTAGALEGSPLGLAGGAYLIHSQFVAFVQCLFHCVHGICELQLLRVLPILLLTKNLSGFLCFLHLQGVYGDPADPFHPIGEVRFVQILHNKKENFHFRKESGLAFLCLCDKLFIIRKKGEGRGEGRENA